MLLSGAEKRLKLLSSILLIFSRNLGDTAAFSQAKRRPYLSVLFTARDSGPNIGMGGILLLSPVVIAGGRG
jgi:hypothetical protein